MPRRLKPLDAPDRRRLPILLRHAWYGLNQAFRRRIAHTGVTPDQFTVLRTLLETQPEEVTQSEVTRLMASDPNTIASLLERMEQSGLLNRKQKPEDRRAYHISITEQGRHKYEEVRQIALALQSEILSGFPEQEREKILEALEQIAIACQGAAERSPKNTRKAPQPKA